MKTYKVLLKEVEYYYVDVEAENAKEAEYKVEKMLQNEPVDYYEATDSYSDGFEVVFGEAEEL